MKLEIRSNKKCNVNKSLYMSCEILLSVCLFLSVPLTCSKGQVPVGGVVWDSGGQLGDLHAVFLLFRALQRTRLYHAHCKSLPPP